MCGIAGMVAVTWQDDLPRRLAAAAGCLEHRGPDGEGFLVWPGSDGELRPVAASGALRPVPQGPVVALAHRRLAIIDLSSAASQPMVSGDGRLAVVLNGEIYNYRELRAELEAAGRAFRTSSDTEVLLEGFAAWGAGVLSRLIGMYAFALLDRGRRRLLLARDPFGIKPLLLARRTDGIAFASEFGALLALTGAPPEADAQAVVDFMQRHGTDLPGRTMFAGVERLAAGHLLDVALDDPAAARPEPFWRPTVRPRGGVSLAKAAAELRTLFLDEIALHLRSDVPLAFALSGGLDSSAIITGARQVLGADAELHAFSFVPEDAALSEEPYATLAAGAAGARLHKVEVHPQELADDFADLAWHQGEPFHGPTIYAQRRVFQRAAASGIKVLLEGQGADELLGGYDGYLPARAASLLRQGRVGAATALLSGVPGGRARKLLHAGMLAIEPLDAVLNPLRRLKRKASPGGFRRDWILRCGVRIQPPARGGRHGGPFTTALARSVWGNPLQALLRFGDRNAMTSSLENRVPFLTPRLADFLLGLPEDHLLAPDGARKLVLRAAMRDIVPAPILARTDKVGFATPVVEWLIQLKPWVDGLLGRLADAPFADAATVRAQWQAVQGTRDLTGALRVWRWLSLQAWIERYGVRVPA